jgi:hypothetical protein
MDDFFHVAIMTPVLHYTMGGLEIDPESRVLSESKAPVQGLFAAGEVAGGVHGANRLGGSSLLGCVVFGRVSGDSAAAYLLQQTSKLAGGQAVERLGAVAGHLGAEKKPATKDAQEEQKTQKGQENAPAAAGPEKKAGSYSMEEVAKHNKKDDCWVVVDGQVLDVTSVSFVSLFVVEYNSDELRSSCPTTLEARRRSSSTQVVTQQKSSTCCTTRRYAHSFVTCMVHILILRCCAGYPSLRTRLCYRQPQEVIGANVAAVVSSSALSLFIYHIAYHHGFPRRVETRL